MIGTKEGYWYSLVERYDGLVAMVVHLFGDTVTEEFCVQDAEVDEVFDSYRAVDYKRRRIASMERFRS